MKKRFKCDKCDEVVFKFVNIHNHIHVDCKDAMSRFGKWREATRWRAWDLDGTLALYSSWKGIEHIGEPIKPTVDILKSQLEAGEYCKIFTARISSPNIELSAIKAPIEHWCLKHLGQVLEITNEKDIYCSVIYDDRAIQVIHNTGEIVTF